MRKLQLVVLVATILAMPAIDQDSVAYNSNGDAKSPWAPADQCFSYTVDMTPFQASWGTDFAICPLIKSSKARSSYFSSLLSAQALSRNQLDLGDNLRQFSAAFAEYSYTNEAETEQHGGIVGGIVALDATDPLSLSVTRVMAAISGENPNVYRSAFGMGAVDAQRQYHASAATTTRPRIRASPAAIS